MHYWIIYFNIYKFCLVESMVHISILHRNMLMIRRLNKPLQSRTLEYIMTTYNLVLREKWKHQDDETETSKSKNYKNDTKVWKTSREKDHAMHLY